MPNPERSQGESQDETSGAAAVPAGRAAPRGAERAERLARLRAALPGARGTPDRAAGRREVAGPAAEGSMSEGFISEESAAAGSLGENPFPEAGRAGPVPGTAPDRPRAARLPAWGLDPFSGLGPLAGFAEAPEGFAPAPKGAMEAPDGLAETPGGFAELSRGFSGAGDPSRRAPVPKPTPVPDFRAPAEERRAGGDASRAPLAGLDQLPGVGPGLLWALDRAGVGGLADLAALEPGALAERLGPIGRLVPARAWIAAARAARGE